MRYLSLEKGIIARAQTHPGKNTQQYYVEKIDLC